MTIICHNLLNSGLLVIILLLLRSLAGDFFPRRMYVYGWLVAMCRMIIPYSIPIKKIGETSRTWNSVFPDISSQSFEKNNVSHNVFVIWGVGTAFFFMLFIIKYYKEYLVLNQGLPWKDAYLSAGYELCDYEKMRYGILKKITGRMVYVTVSDQILAPTTCGIIKPHIVLPKCLDFHQKTVLKHILIHESIHIKYYDNLIRLFSVMVACLYWFNPFAWLIFFCLGKDIELSCDQKTVYFLGNAEKKEYTLSLLFMAGYTVKGYHFHSNFVGINISERIGRIMKYDFGKKHWCGIVMGTCICALSLGVFVSGAQNTYDTFADDVFSDGTYDIGETKSAATDENFADTLPESNISDDSVAVSGYDDSEESKEKVSAENDSEELPMIVTDREWYKKNYPELSDEEISAILKLHEENREMMTDYEPIE